MFKKINLFIIPLLLTSCISVDADSAAVTAGPDFVTSTLPPTRQGFVPSTLTPTLEATAAPTLAITAPPNCTDGAILLRDVTIQDNTQARAGETFVKTWELQNVGTCPWVNYTLVFAAGDRMDAPDSAPVPTTLEDEKVEVSVELTAPTASGTYTGFFSLRNANDRAVAIGTEQTFWVKVIVGGPGAVPLSPGVSLTQTGSPPSGGGSASCDYTRNAGYVDQVAAAINAERANAGLPALTISSQLAALAQSHAADMACSDRISHSGSDGSTPYARAVAAGYAGAFNEEIIYGGGGPQAAMIWWMNDKVHRDAILKAKTTEMGVGYAYFSNGAYGDFIVVEFGTK